MAKANQHTKYFTRRGEIKTKINFNNEIIDVTISIPTNFQHDKLMEEYTDMNSEGAFIHGAELIETRLVRHIIDLPFEVPITENIDGDYVMWTDATEGERRCAVRLMDSTLRELINNKILGESQLSEDEVEN